MESAHLNGGDLHQFSTYYIKKIKKLKTSVTGNKERMESGNKENYITTKVNRGKGWEKEGLRLLVLLYL